jgi:sulfate adenylyltransferase subunit 2
MNKYHLTHLKELEAESIFIIREVVAQFENPVLLFSGGKDSIVCHHLARKGILSSKCPFSP